MESYEAKEKISKLSASLVRIETKALDENRGPDREEATVIAEMTGAIEELKKWLPEKSLTFEGGNVSMKAAMAGEGYRLLAPNEIKSYSNLFGTKNHIPWTDKETSFLAAVQSGRHHPGLRNVQAAMSETVPSDGGFLVDTQTANSIHSISLENELVMPKAWVQPMKSNECHIPAMTIGDRSSGSLYGGFTASYKGEASTITQANPTTRELILKALKLVGYVRMSNELADDSIGGEKQIVDICGKGLAYYRDQAFLNGSGVASPIGIMNSNCLVTVDKESGQAADTVTYENFLKCMRSFYMPSFKNSMWICHQTTIPQLLSMSIAVGVGGSVIPVMKESKDGLMTILTRPVVFTDKIGATLGDLGDVVLADFSQYVVGLRSGMKIDKSIHVQFETDEAIFRLIERHCGQPLWDEPLTLADGLEVSPFVTIEARD